MIIIQLQSDLIDAVDYDGKNLHLTIYLSNSQIREFAEVPAFVIDDLQAAKPPGAYYIKLIKSRYLPRN